MSERMDPLITKVLETLCLCKKSPWQSKVIVDRPPVCLTKDQVFVNEVKP